MQFNGKRLLGIPRSRDEVSLVVIGASWTVASVWLSRRVYIGVGKGVAFGVL